MIPYYIFLHHSVSSRDRTRLADVNAWHKARGFNMSQKGFYVGYQWLIEGDGLTTQTRNNFEEGAHTLGGYNQKSIGICLTGNFMIEEPSLAQLNSLQPLLDKLKKDYNISDEKILYHGQVWPTDCCGKHLIKWLNLYRQVSFLTKMIEKIKWLLSQIK